MNQYVQLSVVVLNCDSRKLTKVGVSDEAGRPSITFTFRQQTASVVCGSKGSPFPGAIPPCRIKEWYVALTETVLESWLSDQTPTTG